MDMKNLENLAKLVRRYILTSTTEAGTGHPTSSLSATDLMVTLMFGGFFKSDLDNPENINNDRLIFSKGHAAPLFYSLYAAAGKVSEDELKSLRKFGSRLEGHPTMEFPYTEAATGSLGQGLSIGLGMALNARAEKLNYKQSLKSSSDSLYKTYVLMGDSEMAEGSVWEAMEIATHYKLDNLIGIIDVNRLGQRGETLLGHDTKTYQQRTEAFGWKTWVIDGHDLEEIVNAFKEVLKDKSGSPKMIIAKTLKGKGVSFLEDTDGWHGKAVPSDRLEEALKEIGEVKTSVGKVEMPRNKKVKDEKLKIKDIKTEYKTGDMVATRKAYGNILVKLAEANDKVVVLDAEVSNSTMSESVKKKYPERFFEMYIAEQNMVGAALGFSRRGKIPFISTFAAFFSRAFDQIRMSQYANPNIKFVGSHAGVSIGEDGASQMALEDIAMFRTLHDGVVLYPSDGVSTEKLSVLSAEHKGNVYIRTTRAETPVIYNSGEEFKIGGFKKHGTSIKGQESRIVVIGAGITLHESLKAQKELAEEEIAVDVIDLYTIKPIDSKELMKAINNSQAIITVEDHYEEGGLGEAVRSALCEVMVPIHSLAVRKMARSGKPMELLDYEEISAKAIIEKVKSIK